MEGKLPHGALGYLTPDAFALVAPARVTVYSTPRPEMVECGGTFPDMDRATTARGDDLLLNIDGASVCLLPVQRVWPSNKRH